MMRISIAMVLALGLLVTAAAGAVHAQSAGASYFCQKHPNAAQCVKHKPPKAIPITGAGGTAPIAGSSRSGVAGLSTSPAQPASLPQTGGGAPTSPAGNDWVLVLAVLALLSGFGLRLAASRT